MPKDQNCFSETKPISKEEYWGSGSDTKMMQIAEAEISKLKSRGLKIQILNITQLSEYRKDGHPSIYRKQWRPLSKEKLSDPRNYADCTHWCLPGVPDVWNELLFTYIIHHWRHYFLFISFSNFFALSFIFCTLLISLFMWSYSITLSCVKEVVMKR